MEADRYECRRCACRGTPICRECTEILFPKGRSFRPKYHVLMSEEAENFFGLELKYANRDPDMEAEKLRGFLEKLIAKREILPLRAVMKYNKIRDAEKGSENGKI